MESQLWIFARLQTVFVVGAAWICFLLTGCGEGRAVGVPQLDADQVAKAAVDACDVDDNRQISKSEATPALLAVWERLDTDKNDLIAPEELKARVEAWKASGAGMIPVRCAFTYKRAPLVGATIKLHPEPYLGVQIQPATGKTNRFGWANLSIPVELRPGDEQRGGIRFGIYSVTVSLIENGEETIPKEYNTESKLGVEISMDSPGVQAGLVSFKLE